MSLRRQEGKKGRKNVSRPAELSLPGGKGPFKEGTYQTESPVEAEPQQPTRLSDCPSEKSCNNKNNSPPSTGMHDMQARGRKQPVTETSSVGDHLYGETSSVGERVPQQCAPKAAAVLLPRMEVQQAAPLDGRHG